ncbi:MAG: helix-turn-helix domain-containing protein [Actinomycetota bacterium]|nr:helix-turn-helix domain-containing protein [Actinomycetota bacterium]
MPEPVLDVAALYGALDERRRSRGLSWRVLASEAGVSASTLTRMAQGRRPDVDSFAALTGWLGQSADLFLRRSPTDSVAEEEPLAVISTLLRARKDLSPASVDAIEEIVRAAYDRFRERDMEDETPSRIQGGRRTSGA